MPAVITASSVLCAGGRGTEQLWATVRAGISCIKNSFNLDRNFEPIQMGLVPEDELAPLSADVASEPLPSIARRMLRLATPTLASLAEFAGPAPLSVYLGLPQVEPAEAPWLAKFLQQLSKATGIPIDPGTSKIFPNGRAAALLALEAALTQLSLDPAGVIVVGGVDSFLDLRRIALLDREARILGPRVMDGFIPGEGAGFIVLKDASAVKNNAIGAQVKILGGATASDAGHRYGAAPARGEGLADAIDKLRSMCAANPPPVASTFASFNGENFEAKLWGVARLRHSDFFLPDMVIRHPADIIGDTGAAAGAILTALGAFSLLNGQQAGSALVWAASDFESRGCALLSN
jgi:3-oxoacyl-[acyl-carrier-protein] synthase-1